MSHANHRHQARQRGESNSTELTDPVCGMAVKKTSFHKVEFQGRLYSFCSAHCRSKFMDNPQRYLTGSERAEGDANTEYSCPMHQEVRQLILLLRNLMAKDYPHVKENMSKYKLDYMESVDESLIQTRALLRQLEQVIEQ